VPNGRRGNEKAWIKRAEIYNQRNHECACIILADPNRYGSDGSLMVEWAKVICQASTAVGCSGGDQERLAIDHWDATKRQEFE
jgi:hypothetical protein